MDKFKYNQESRIFTYQSVVKDEYSTIKQAIVHVLKLKYKFDYDRDRLKHIGSIKEFIKEINKKLNRDPKCKYRHILEIGEAYRALDNPVATINEFKKFFNKKYNYTGDISREDYDYAVYLIINLLWYDEDSIVRELESEFPEDN